VNSCSAASFKWFIQTSRAKSVSEGIEFGHSVKRKSSNTKGCLPRSNRGKHPLVFFTKKVFLVHFGGRSIREYLNYFCDWQTNLVTKNAILSSSLIFYFKSAAKKESGL
jgi:hypothetical protein